MKVSVGQMVEKECLFGGRSTSEVYRIGDVLYRTSCRNSELYVPLLRFFEERGVTETYRYLGNDGKGHDMFSFLEGYIPPDVGGTTQSQLRQFMGIVRRLHDVSSDFPTAGDGVICHNDLSPCNTVFRSGTPVAVIDWDSASPGERWEDLTRIVWLWTNIGSHSRVTDDLLWMIPDSLVAYGADFDTIRNFSSKLKTRMKRDLASADRERWDYERTVDWVEFSLQWVEENSDELDRLTEEAVQP